MLAQCAINELGLPQREFGSSVVKLTARNSNVFNTRKIPGDVQGIRTRDISIIERVFFHLTH